MANAESPPLWPDDVKIGDVDGAMYQMPSEHRYVISRSLAASRPDIVEVGRAAMTRHVLDHAPSALPIVFATHNIDHILDRHRVPMRDKAWALMAEIVRQLAHKPGRVDWQTSPLTTEFLDVLRRVGVGLDDEITHLLTYLDATGRIRYKPTSTSALITLPVEGLIEFEAEQVDAETNDAFVAMWFNHEVTPVYDEAMIPAIEHWGYRAIRVDRKEHNNKIDDEIISAIRRSKFLVADFSCGADGARGGVYFEAGFAAGLGKPVIFTVRAQDLARVHFDTRQYNHIVWETTEGLREALENRIGATIGQAERI